MDILSVFGIRGRPKEVHRLSDALRNAGIHPALVPDSVKIAVIKLLRENDGGKISDIDTSCEKAAPMVAYCMLDRKVQDLPLVQFVIMLVVQNQLLLIAL